MIVKKMNYIFLLVFTLQNYNFCCEECCDYCEKCWNNCWNKFTTVKKHHLPHKNNNIQLHHENDINNNIYFLPENIKNNIHLWPDANTTDFNPNKQKMGKLNNPNCFETNNTFAYYEEIYIPTPEEIREKGTNFYYKGIKNRENMADFINKNNDCCVIVKNIFPLCKQFDVEKPECYCVYIFLIYEKKEQNVYEFNFGKSFYAFDEKKKMVCLSNKEKEYRDSMKEKIKDSLHQDLANIRYTISLNLGVYDIELPEEGENNNEINYDLQTIKNNLAQNENFDVEKYYSNKDNCRRGLENIGATCYMNATLQCFAHIAKFVNFFKGSKQVRNIIEKKIEEDDRSPKLTVAFTELLQNLYPAKNDKNNLQGYYSPKNFKETISRMNPLFEGIAANDAKDLINFLIMTLHAELNRCPPEEINMGNLLQDQTNKQLMFQNFARNFTKTHQSIISDIFYAMNCNITQCLNCRVMSYNYQIYFFLIFPLEEVRKFVLMNNGGFNNNFNTNKVNIYDCFNFDRKINSMSGDNAMYCNYCKQTCASQMCTNLTTGPEVLIIILNRGKGIEFDVKLDFFEELNLSNYIEIQNTGTQYDLFGVITHIGESGMGGHFIAYCRDLWNNNTWYRYNDAIVTPVNSFKDEVVNFAMPYLLFYKKKDNNML